ncbi:ABC transporter ATP-binding protein [Alkalibacter mobilis]|uniref:ABC transporter ATP-binding protein n=1 Tax=Alkalibacter mobilis TaxID=2787712 RepID=UPI00189CD3D3|nr:ABC transporter ATP-binding protein [Alkalibacter mobilis]MBF7097767.1 energy-coupling factor ABC transporter ATP-binding protein [Alkalibacter mobilis]
MSMIEVSHLYVEINGRIILKDINITFETNERILILGESGCGKSTLLLALLGIVQKYDNMNVSGDVLINGISIVDMEPIDLVKVFGIVFQNPESQFCSLYPKDEVAFGLENQCVDPNDMENIIELVMKDFDFPEEKENYPINILSGGEQQRLALACVAAMGSEMILMDEPTANLDPEGRRQVIVTAKKAGLEGKGLFVVEHNLESWLPFLDRLIVVGSDGTIFCDGNYREMFHLHWKRFVEKGIWCPHTLQISRVLEKKGYTFYKIPCCIQELKDENISCSILNQAVSEYFDADQKEDEQFKKAVLKLERLTAGYGRNHMVLNSINLTVYEGDFFALVGGNGSGKSTLSKAILNLVPIIDGSISILGKDISKYKANDVHEIIGYVFQNPEHQFVEDTVWSELAYSHGKHTMDKDSIKNEIFKLLKDFDLEKHIEVNPFNLSGGQKRRLSVATMLIGDRKILILDEPTFGQDVKNTNKIMKKMTRLNNLGMTVIMITHDLDLVDAYANRVAVMNGGEIVYEGNTRGLWNEKNVIEKSGLELPFRIKILEEVGSNAYEQLQSNG